MTGAMQIEPDVLDGVRRATSREGWTAGPDKTWTGDPLVRLTNGPGGRGQKRDTWLIVGGKDMTLADCFRALAECLVALDKENTDGP